MRRLMREITELRNNPPEGIRVVANEENMLDLTGIVEGPGESFNTLDTRLKLRFIYAAEQTPYAGGYFRVRFQFTQEFPAAPPKCTRHFYRFLPWLIPCLHRLVYNQNISPERLVGRRDLCKHAEEGLASVIRNLVHPCDHQVPPHLSKS